MQQKTPSDISESILWFAVIAALLFLIVFVNGCSGAPAKPNPEICVIDYPRTVAYCGHPNPKHFNSTTDLTYDKTIREILAAKDTEEKPLSYLHKAVSFTPPNWELVQNYMDELRAYAETNCKAAK